MKYVILIHSNPQPWGHPTDRLTDEGEASPGQVAVFYRTNAQSRVMEEGMRRQGIDYRLVGGFSFYGRAEIRDALAYARLCTNLRDSAAFLRVVNSPPRGIGGTTLERLQESARRGNLSLWQALEEELAAKLLPARSLKALEGFHRLMQELAAERERAPDVVLYDGAFDLDLVTRIAKIDLQRLEQRHQVDLLHSLGAARIAHVVERLGHHRLHFVEVLFNFPPQNRVIHGLHAQPQSRQRRLQIVRHRGQNPRAVGEKARQPLLHDVEGARGPPDLQGTALVQRGAVDGRPQCLKILVRAYTLFVLDQSSWLYSPLEQMLSDHWGGDLGDLMLTREEGE